ncbi:hypothetical protein NT2_12_01530 [Caenibius tardaugens NBRC 16725]|uniref:CinA C-terminal domain-containing protein n=1 Tax=Caenibius tardaugens NBRC 16725 TaxID=1219035 RepID=U2YPP8_9SPHN|nr:CinA family protein [Caenibius tardaugens]AZI36316.1 CinA family protein [Caenibius tardaugens NBRC 16725]GAD50895.1 hypothetical protein NT2_12_01530 [Caenibius tardaugens NBRC 16725]
MDFSSNHKEAETLEPALPADLICDAIMVLKVAVRAGLKIATAESCTGGMLASLLTDIEGVSHVFDRGFVTYSDASKCDLLGISPDLIFDYGAVSEPIVCAMARGALQRSEASLAIAITGFTGKGSPSEEAGLVHLACAMSDGTVHHQLCHFGDIGRGTTRIATLRVAVAMLRQGADHLAISYALAE